MYRRIHCYDLDGVLVDTSHRYRNLSDGSIDLAFWFANRTAKQVARDRLLPLARQFAIDCDNPETYTILCTAREYHSLDCDYISRYLGKPNKLIMRPVGNTTTDSKLKRSQLSRLFNLRQFAKLHRRLWEDNPRNIATLRPIFNDCFFVTTGTV